MTEEYLNNVYDILVEIGGACDNERPIFIFSHLYDSYPCTEFRFCGHFGFGGKYRVNDNRIDCYPEDMTDELKELIKIINQKLNEL